MSEGSSRVSVMPYVAGTLCILAFLLVGLAAPVFMEMFRDFGIDPLPPRLRIVSVIQWWWTVPLAVGIALLLVRGRTRWSVRASRIAGITIIIVSVAILLAFGLAVFTPVFKL